MFQNRASAQKPGDEFIANFRQNFPVVGLSTSRGGSSAGGTPGVVDTIAGEPPLPDRHHSLGNEEMKDLDPTPRAQNEPWRFTPSLLDPNSMAFSSFANQPPNYYTPPAGSNALFHSQAGDLHTPGMGMSMGMGTPFSQPTSVDGVPNGAMMDMSTFSNSIPAQFQNYDPFGQSPEQSFAPSSFVHHDTGYETMDHDGSPMDDRGRMGSMDAGFQHHSPVVSFQPAPYDMTVAAPMPPSAERFRFHVTLNAPTAMVKGADEIPITYLNKGQAYSISIVDTAPALPLPAGMRYRTFIRISFEDEQQRQRPVTCWQLWKEGRGTSEAHQRGGKLQAVEYVDTNQPAENDHKGTGVDLDTASFDGFSIMWSPSANGSAECNIAVRFNFLSTDFSHSKGVKGIPVRLCAKTETISSGPPHSSVEPPEVAYCEVKLFRDHGAERKLSNDVAHVKKTIDKLKQSIAKVESGMKDFGKRKRASPIAIKGQPTHRPGKVQKHKRTWSMSSASSSGGRQPIEEDLHYKLQAMQDMFTSTRPVSVLYLRGSDLDDPDLHPVALVGEPVDITKVDPSGNPLWQQRSSDHGSAAGASTFVSPASSSISLRSQGVSAAAWNEHHPLAVVTDLHSASPHQLISPPDQPTKIPKVDETGNLCGWIEALGVDPAYKPPVIKRAVTPVACFYIQHHDAAQPENHEYHRAIYPVERTLKEFTRCVAAKWNLDAGRITRALHVTERGLQVEMDDDVIRELAEGQDFTMEIAKIANGPAGLKREWEMADDDGSAASTAAGTHGEGYELRLMF